MMIRQTGSSMFKNRVNNKEDIFSENVMNKIRLRLQKERNMNHLLDKSKKTNIQDVFKNLPQELFKAFIPQEEAEQTDNRKFPTDIMKGLYGVKKSIVLKNSQKMESFKFMKTTSLDKNNFYLSHLSSNRSLDRFSRIFETNQFNKKKLNNEIKLFLDKKTSQKIKKSLMKFKSNILIAISRLEVVKRGKYLTPNQDPLIVRRFGLSMN